MSILISEYEEYQKGKLVYIEVSETYENVIENVKHYFMGSYDEIINEHTLDEEELDDKDKLSTAKIALETLMENIKSEQNIVCDET